MSFHYGFQKYGKLKKNRTKVNLKKSENLNKMFY